MKNLKRLSLLLALALIACQVQAQFAIGLRAGANFANETIDPIDEDVDLKSITALNAAVVFEIGLGESFAIQPELALIQKGSKTVDDVLNEDLELKFTNIEVPVLLKFRFGSESFKAFITAGPTFGYLASGKYTFGDESETLEGDDWDDINRLEIGASVGAGIGFGVGPGTLFLDGRYLLGLSDLDKTDDSKVTNKGIGLSLGYLIPLGGE
jgi:hypothetical protein